MASLRKIYSSQSKLAKDLDASAEKARLHSQNRLRNQHVKKSREFQLKRRSWVTIRVPEEGRCRQLSAGKQAIGTVGENGDESDGRAPARRQISEHAAE
jgi:hypothetical protein